jgi:hypothetical protein
MRALGSCAHRTGAVVLGLLPSVCGGCGLVLVHGPPPFPEQGTRFECTQSNTGPALDVAAAALGGLLTVLAATEWSQPDSYYYYASDEITYSAAAATGLYGVSAYVGFRKTKKCRAAMEQPLMQAGFFDPIQGVFSAVSTSGELALIRDDSLRYALGSWPSGLQGAREEEQWIFSDALRLLAKSRYP